MPESELSIWQPLVGQDVVLDLASPFVVLGRLEVISARHAELTHVDVHDLRDTQTTREKYVLESRRHGIRANRTRAWIALAEVVAVSRLADVIVD